MQLLIESTSKTASKRLERLEKKIGGSTSLMAEVAALIAERNKAGFKTGVKLQPATVEYKAKYGMSTEPLTESGRMRRELTTEKGIKLITSTELVFGSSDLAKGEGRGREITVAKATLLQKGTKHQKKHKVLKVTPTTRVAISELIMEKIKEP